MLRAVVDHFGHRPEGGHLNIVSVEAYPDPKNPNLVVVELAAGKPLKRPVTLAEIKADKRFADMPLTRIPRLSVQPVTDEQWDWIENLSKFAD